MGLIGLGSGFHNLAPFKFQGLHAYTDYGESIEKERCAYFLNPELKPPKPLQTCGCPEQ